MKQEQLSPRGQAGPPESLGVPTAQETSVLRGKSGPVTLVLESLKAHLTVVSLPLTPQGTARLLLDLVQRAVSYAF